MNSEADDDKAQPEKAAPGGRAEVRITSVQRGAEVPPEKFQAAQDKIAAIRARRAGGRGDARGKDSSRVAPGVFPPRGYSSYLVRTDFSDQSGWERLRDAAFAPSEEGFEPDYRVVDAHDLQSTSAEQLLDASDDPVQQFGAILVIADTEAIRTSRLLVVDVLGRRQVRADPQKARLISTNVTLGVESFDAYLNEENR
ncbi:DUF6924 domain-containing protein [Gordonia aichiensis]